MRDDYTMDIFNNSSNVRRNETICCLIGFGIGVGCCILYRFISNFLTPSTNTNSLIVSQRVIKTPLSSDIYSKRKRLHEHDDYICHNNNISDEMTWSEMSSSLSTVNLLQDSYHSNSLTGDSGVDCPEISHEHEVATECHVMSYISTEKGLERALEQTSRFYTDLEHIAIDLGTLTKRYSQSETSLSHRSIDALDWDWHDDVSSPKLMPRKQQLVRSNNNKNKVRRRLNTNYTESDHENRSFDYSTSPLRRKPSTVYFDSSDEDNLGDETLQIHS